MKKKYFSVLLTLVTLLCCLFALTACGNSSELGKYYLKDSDNKEYIELQANDKWASEKTDVNGTYTLAEDGIITLKSGDNVYATGTLKDGTLKLTLTGTDTAKEYKMASRGWFEQYWVYIVLAVLVVLLIAWFFFSNRKSKTRQKEYVEQLEAIRPGNKVKTAGGICGIVVEVCDDNTVVIETGTEKSGKSYIKMDKELIAQTDAKGPTQIAREAAEEAKKAQKDGKAPVAKTETSEEPAAEEAQGQTFEQEKPEEPEEPKQDK